MRGHVVMLDPAPYQVAFVDRMRSQGVEVRAWCVRTGDLEGRWSRHPDVEPVTPHEFSRAIGPSEFVVVHGYSPWPLPSILYAARKSGALVVLRSDANFQSTLRHGRAAFSMKRALNRLVASWVDFCAVVGTAGQLHYRACGVRSDKVLVSPFEVERGLFRPQPEEARCRRLISVGRLDSNKNPELLLEAFARSRMPKEDWRLAFVGDGPKRPALLSRAEELGIADVVDIRGPIVDRVELATLMGESAAFGMTSRSEKWGVAMLEAASCGLALVASSRAGATRDLVVDGVSGVVVDPEDLQALVGGLDTVSGRWRTLGASALAAAGDYLGRDELTPLLLGRSA